MSAEALSPAPVTAHLQLVEANGAPAWARPQRMPRPPAPLALVPPAPHPAHADAVDEAKARLARLVALPRIAEASSPAPTSTQAPEAARTHARALAQALAEVLHGLRPSHQLSHWLDLDMLHKMQRRARWELEAARALGSERGTGPAQVLGCHVQQVGEACECSATLATRHGARAVCFRLELRRNRWRGVAVELG